MPGRWSSRFVFARIGPLVPFFVRAMVAALCNMCPTLVPNLFRTMSRKRSWTLGGLPYLGPGGKQRQGDFKKHYFDIAPLGGPWSSIPANNARVWGNVGRGGTKVVLGGSMCNANAPRPSLPCHVLAISCPFCQAHAARHNFTSTYMAVIATTAPTTATIKITAKTTSTTATITKTTTMTLSFHRLRPRPRPRFRLVYIPDCD